MNKVQNFRLFRILFPFLYILDQKIPFVIQFIEEHFGGSGSENEVLDVQPDLSLNLVVHTKAPSFYAPEVTSDDLSEDSEMQILDLTPHLWDSLSRNSFSTLTPLFHLLT